MRDTRIIVSAKPKIPKNAKDKNIFDVRGQTRCVNRVLSICGLLFLCTACAATPQYAPLNPGSTVHLIVHPLLPAELTRTTTNSSREPVVLCAMHFGTDGTASHIITSSAELDDLASTQCRRQVAIDGAANRYALLCGKLYGSGGYRVALDTPVETANALELRYHIEAPPLDAITTAAFEQPCVLVSVPRDNRTVLLAQGTATRAETIKEG